MLQNLIADLPQICSSLSDPLLSYWKLHVSICLGQKHWNPPVPSLFYH